MIIMKTKLCNSLNVFATNTNRKNPKINKRPPPPPSCSFRNFETDSLPEPTGTDGVMHKLFLLCFSFSLCPRSIIFIVSVVNGYIFNPWSSFFR